ncbi:MAG: phosphotransferase [Rhodoferax sp.]
MSTITPTPLPSGLPALSAHAIAWSDAPRALAFDHWLNALAEQHTLDRASLRPASADASFRRYFRIDSTLRSSDGASSPISYIIMDAPPQLENSQPFVQVATLMQQAGVRVPQVLSWDAEWGFMLLTDLGPRTLLQALDIAHPEANLPRFQQALDALLNWQAASRPGVLPAYDAALLQRELALFPDWYLARHRGVQLTAAQQQVLSESFARIVQTNLASASVFVHRDFMPRNLIVADDPALPLGVLDFQDAVYGPITYDIASLMRDAFVSWDEAMVIDVTVRYWERARKRGLPVDEDFGAFYRAVEWMALQRHLKVAGIFARLTLRDGKPQYLADAPRFIGYIRATCARYTGLKPLLRLIDQIEGIQEPAVFGFGRQA